MDRGLQCFSLAEYLESEPERLQARAEAQRVKLRDLEKKLGIEHRESRKFLRRSSQEINVGLMTRNIWNKVGNCLTVLKVQFQLDF